MAKKKPTRILLEETQLKKVRKMLKAQASTKASTKAFKQALIDQEIRTTLKELIRKGRGRFVDVYR